MTPPPPILPAGDIEHILTHTRELWQELRGARLFITGATGFWGTWLLESIAAANDRLGANVSATLLSRNPSHFSEKLPRLAERREFQWLKGDTQDFTFPDGRFDHVIHLATTSAAEVGAGDTALILATLAGTERVLRFATASGVKRLLFASSGAVYGPQPPGLDRIPEDYAGTPDLRDPMSAYGEIKRISELLCLATAGIDCVIARGFAFIGPYLPLTDKFAAGSFLRDALTGGPIRIRDDGSAVRSYMYGADLAIWLLTILVRARGGTAWNVGSDEPVSMRQLAESIMRHLPDYCAVEVGEAQPDSRRRYVPDITRARDELGLEVAIGLDQAIERSLAHAAADGRRDAVAVETPA